MNLFIFCFDEVREFDTIYEILLLYQNKKYTIKKIEKIIVDGNMIDSKKLNDEVFSLATRNCTCGG